MDHILDCEITVRNLHDGDPAMASALNELAKARRAAWQSCGDPELLNAALDNLRCAISLTEGDRLEESHRYRNNLGVFLAERAGQQNGNRACDDLRESIDILESAITSSTPAPNLHCTLHLNLANSLQSLYDLSDDTDVLDRAIIKYEEGLTRVTTQGNMSKLLSGLSSSALSRFLQSRHPPDLDMALERGEQSLRQSDEFHPFRATFLDVYASALFVASTSRQNDLLLEKAIAYGLEAMERSTGSFKWPQFVSNYASYLIAKSRTQTNHSHGLDDLEQAISLLQEASEENRAQYGPVTTLIQYRYALALRYRFERRGAEGDLSTALTILETILDASSSATPAMRDSCTVEIANTLLDRFDLCGAPGDVDNAVIYLRDLSKTALRPEMAKDVFANLSVVLLARFELRGSIDDLNDAEDAVLVSREIENAFDLCDDPDSMRSSVSLANIYLRTFQETGDEEHLKQAIQLYEDAVGETSPRMKLLQPGRLATLGYALQLRCGKKKDTSQEEWQHCIQVCEEALEQSKSLNQSPTTGSGIKSNCWKYYGHLGSAYLERYKARDGQEDLTQEPAHLALAIQHLEEACKQAPEDHMSRALFLNNLGLSHELFFNENNDNRAEYHLAIQHYRECNNMSTASNLQRITAAYRGLALTAKRDLRSAVEFATSAIELLPTLSSRLVGRPDQEYLTTVFSGLGSYSVAVFLEAGYTPAKALVALEATRGIMTGLTIDTRQDLAALEQNHPELAAEFDALSRQLDPPPSLSSARSNEFTDEAMKSDERIKAGKRFDALTKQIRSLDGFETFLTPPTEGDMRQVAGDAFIVVINITSLRSDALVVNKDSIRSIRLEKAALDAVVKNANKLMKALKANTASRQRRTNQHLRDILSWLWEAVVGPIYDALAVEKGQRLRICWMPIGIMSFFPLHAATSNIPLSDALDLIVSSYGTAFKCLRLAHENAARAQQNQRASPATPMKATLVSMATTPGGHVDLEYAAQEVSSLEQTLSNSPLFDITCLAQPSKADLLPALGDTVVLHMSCHGIALREEPSSSYLLLEDWEENPLTVADLAAHRLPKAQFCYLSACHAAANLAPELLDESVHLASAMQLAGFPHVVGTLWNIDDRRAMEVSKRFWEALLARGRGSQQSTNPGDRMADFGGIAEALNAATVELKERTKRVELGGGSEEYIECDDQPFVWSPFIYVGL